MQLESTSPWLGFSQLLNGTSCSVSSELFVREAEPVRGRLGGSQLVGQPQILRIPPLNAGGGLTRLSLPGCPLGHLILNLSPVVPRGQPEEELHFLECFAGALTGVSQITRMPHGYPD